MGVPDYQRPLERRSIGVTLHRHQVLRRGQDCIGTQAAPGRCRERARDQQRDFDLPAPQMPQPPRPNRQHPLGDRACGAAGDGFRWQRRDWRNASIVSVTDRACGAPAFAASLAVPPISRTGRPSSDAADASPAVVRFHKSHRTGRPFTPGVDVRPTDSASPACRRSLHALRTVCRSAVPGSTNCRSCSAVATFTTPSANNTRPRARAAELYGHSALLFLS